MSGSALPNAKAAQIADAKVRDFILNAAHVENKGRAAFFLAIGFNHRQWDVLRDALLAHPVHNSVYRVTPTGFGTRYRVRCSIVSPDSRNPCIETVWVIDRAAASPAFITAYPAPRPVRRAGTAPRVQD